MDKPKIVRTTGTETELLGESPKALDSLASGISNLRLKKNQSSPDREIATYPAHRQKLARSLIDQYFELLAEKDNLPLVGNKEDTLMK